MALEGEGGEPWRSAGCYDPDTDPYRGESVSDVAHAHFCQEFLGKYVQGAQAPEPGAARTGGKS
ncbi:hypothetical protein [Streptomyces sp. NPDC051677]|uniref:hypothetical protein n=1 Tax=Streptomyces sp. NPDC051677 TaxID=3365669 RepID=UPI0037D61993